MVTTTRLRAATWLLSGLVLVGLSIAFVDRAVASWSHDVLHRPALAVEITYVASPIYLDGAAILVLAAACIVRFSRGSLSAGWRTAVSAAVATLLALLAVMLVKNGFGRLWPETWTHDNPSWISNHAYGFLPFHGGQGYESFPSGHTARITAPCAVLWQRLPRWRAAWVLPPLVMSAALVAANFHFVGDCIAGAYLAVACAAVAMMIL